MKEKKFPNKAKIITDGGFYKIVKTDGQYVNKLCFPLLKRITLATPETNVMDINIAFSCEFIFQRVYKGYAEYKQYNVTSVIK